MCTLFLIILFHIAYSSKNHSFNLILQFLNQSNSKFAICVLCWPPLDQIISQKFLHNHISTRTVFLPLQETIWKINIKPYNQVAIILDLTCSKAKTIFQKETKPNQFSYNYNWLILCNNTILKTDIAVIVSQMSLRLDSRVKFAIADSVYKFYDIFDVYKPGIRVDIQIMLVGVFKDKRLEYFNKGKSLYETRKNFKGVMLRTANTNYYSFENEEDYLKELRSKGSKEFEKFNFQLFIGLKYIHNFRYNTTICSAWFGNSTSGIDGGIAKLIYEKKIDINTSGGLLRYARVDYFEFLLPHYKFRTSFVFVDPGKAVPGADIFKPFATTTWFVFTVSLVFIGVAIDIAFLTENNHQNRKWKNSKTVSVLIIIISLLAQQGTTTVPRWISGRIILLNLLILSMITYNYFTSSLVSSLISSNPEPISTIEELAISKLQLAIEPQPYTYTYILQQAENNPEFNLLIAKIYQNEKPNFLRPNEGIREIKKGSLAYHTEVSTAYEHLRDADQNIICDLAEITMIPTGDVGMVMQKYSEYTEMFQISLKKMFTNGIYKREMDFWISKKPACLLSLRVKAVAWNNLFLVYLILVVGIGISLIMLCIEIIIYRNNFQK